MRREPPGRREPPRWRVAVVEDHLLQRKHTEALIGQQPGLRVQWSGETFPEFLDWLATTPESSHPDLLVLDLLVERGPAVDPGELQRLINRGLRVLVLSAMASPELVRKVVRTGVGGVAGKRDSEEALIGAIWTVLGRGQWLTPELAGVIAGDSERPRLSEQEERVLVLYASGLTLDAVAEALGVRRDTVKKYLSRVKAKYSATGETLRTKIELNQIARRDGYLDL